MEETYWKRVFPEVVMKRRVKIFMVLLIIQVSLLDPLFFYIPVINDRQKCVRLDKKLGTAVMVFRSLIDFFYVIYIIVELHKHFLVVRRTGKYQYTRLGKIFLIDFLAVLPLPQVVILIFIPTMRGSRFLNAMYLLRSVVLCQFVPRSFRAYLFVTSGTFGAPAKARFKFSPLIFLLGIDVIEAFWYFLSVERLVQCWTKACKTHVGCVNSYYCKDNIGDHTSLKHFCPSDGRKTDFFDFGIFSDAIKDRVLEMTYFPKLLYCFQWSLQNLSGFGQNLKTSTYIWEKLFAISMSILGLFLFFLLLGSLQVKAFQYIDKKLLDDLSKYIELRVVDESECIVEKGKKINDMFFILDGELEADSFGYISPKNTIPHVSGPEVTWDIVFNGLPPSLELSGIVTIKALTRVHALALPVNKVRDFFHHLPNDLKMSVRRELNFDFLKKVVAFKYIEQNVLDYLSGTIQRMIFQEGEYIAKAGEIMNDVVFILHGMIEASGFQKINVLKDGDICGEEVIWEMIFYDPSPSPSSSGSTMTLTPSPSSSGSTMTLTALTRVHALALPVNKVRDFSHHLPNDLKMSLWRELNFVFLKKVEAFKYIDQNGLDYLSGSIQRTIFQAGEYIAKAGEIMNDVVFIVHGMIEASGFEEINVLKNGDICGGGEIWEVIVCDRWPDPSRSDASTASTVTLTALTRVHALALPINKVRDFLHQRPQNELMV